MTTQEIADRLVELCRQGQFTEAQQDLFSDDVVSIEPAGSPTERAVGKEALIAKGEQFGEMVEEMHGMTVSDPIVAGNFFSCIMTMDITYKGGPRMQDSEIAVYEVRDGKIVLEHFFYNQPG